MINISIEIQLPFYHIPGIFHQEFLDEIFGHGAGHAEMMSIQSVVHGKDVPQGLFICLILERRHAAQAEEREKMHAHAHTHSNAIMHSTW